MIPDNIILITAAAIIATAAGLFSGAETGMYQLSRLRLRLGVQQKKISFVILNKLLQDSSGLLISILVGTNLAQYLITSIVTYLLLSRLQSEHYAELTATLITSPILFLFTELIPKNIFFYRPDYLMPRVAPAMFVSHKIFSWIGIVPLFKFLFGKLGGKQYTSASAIAATQKHHISAILQDTHEEGFLSPVQTDIINRLVGISHINVTSVMTPLHKVQAVNIISDKTLLLKKLEQYPFSRLLVYDGQPENVLGFINIYEILNSSEEVSDLKIFVRPVLRVSSETSVSDAIRAIKNEKQKIALVVRAGHTGPEKPLGIVTMKDLVEELLGELVEW